MWHTPAVHPPENFESKDRERRAKPSWMPLSPHHPEAPLAERSPSPPPQATSRMHVFSSDVIPVHILCCGVTLCKRNVFITRIEKCESQGSAAFTRQAMLTSGFSRGDRSTFEVCLLDRWVSSFDSFCRSIRTVNKTKRIQKEIMLPSRTESPLGAETRCSRSMFLFWSIFSFSCE